MVAAAPRLTFEFEPHNCFACGSLNAHGLQLSLHLEDARSWTQLTLDERFEGWQGIAHGGIVSTILDEVMAWALVAEDNWGVTARMQVDFRKPVPIGRSDSRGWVDHAFPPPGRGRRGSAGRRREWSRAGDRQSHLCCRGRGAEA